MAGSTKSDSVRPGSRDWAGWPGIGAVLLATLLWVLVKFNQTYSTSIQYPVQITNMPLEVAPGEDGIRKVKLNCEGLGTRLVVAWLRRNRDTIDIPYKAQGPPDPVVFVDAQASAYLRRKLPTGVRMLSLASDSLRLHFETRTNKRVPLIVKSTFVPPYGYRVDSVMVRDTDSVRLTGPADILEGLTSWTTREVDIEVGANPNVYIVPVDTLAGLDVSPPQVMVYARPRRYAEVAIDAVLNTPNPPQNHVVRYYPAGLTLFCVTPLDQLRNVPQKLEISVPYEQLDLSQGVLYPDVQNFLPPSLALVRWEPRTPRFVVQDTSIMDK